MTPTQRKSLLYATDPKSARHHEWEIRFNWGEMAVLPNGEISRIVLGSGKGIPAGLLDVIDALLIQYARCKINNFSLGQTLIERTLKQIDKQ